MLHFMNAERGDKTQSRALDMYVGCMCLLSVTSSDVDRQSIRCILISVRVYASQFLLHTLLDRLNHVLGHLWGIFVRKSS